MSEKSKRFINDLNLRNWYVYFDLFLVMIFTAHFMTKT